MKLLKYFVYLSEPCVCNLSDWTDGRTSAPAEHIAGRVEEGGRDVSAVSAAHAHNRAFLGVVVGVAAGVVVAAGAGLAVLVRRLRQHKHESPHVLKSPPSDSSTCGDLKSLRLAPSFSGATCSSSGANTATLYGPASVVPGEEGSLYHEPYSKTPLFSASQYSVATLGRDGGGGVASLSRDGVTTLSREGLVSRSREGLASRSSREGIATLSRDGLASRSREGVATLTREGDRGGGGGAANATPSRYTTPNSLVGVGVGGGGADYALPVLTPLPQPPQPFSTTTSTPNTPAAFCHSTTLYSTTSPFR